MIYDKKGEVKKLFRRIIQAAKKAGLVEKEDEQGRYWAIAKPMRLGEVVQVEVKE